MFMKQKKKKQRCFWCGKKFEELANVNGKLSCYICLRAGEKKK